VTSELAYALERAITLLLGAPVCVGVAATGSDALAIALRAAGRPLGAVDSWPCPFASLTHSADTAIAVALPPEVRADGIGIDLEHDREINPGMARLICGAHERAYLATLPADRQPAEVLRLWTAKEALYKADPAQGDSIVAEYTLVHPDAPVTTGGRLDSSHHATVTSLRSAGAVISVALRLTGEPS
jgi:phosphopantetheinyl transferase (holo-ACP synthase)